MAAERAVEVRVEGRVTGVGFRYSAVLAAQRIGGLTGYVRNTFDDCVECFLQGEPASVEEMLARPGRVPGSLLIDSSNAMGTIVSRDSDCPIPRTTVVVLLSRKRPARSSTSTGTPPSWEAERAVGQAADP
jgi:acylphosphatase